MGSALPVFTLSLVKDPKIAGDVSETNALDYSIVMIAKYAGNVIGLPLMTVVWAKGIGTGGAALGSPYFLSAVGARSAYFASNRTNKLEGILWYWTPPCSSSPSEWIR